MTKNIFSSFEKFKKNIALFSNIHEPKTYGDILNDVKNFKKYFIKKNIVLIFCDNSYEFIVTYVAAIKFNQVLILLDSQLNKKDYEKILNKYKPNFIFCKKSFDINNYTKVLKLNEYSFLKRKILFNFPINKEISCLISTSGTTGEKKFVKIGKSNLLSNTLGITKMLGIKKKDITITTMPPNYSYALSIINTHLMNGAKIILNRYSLIDRNFWDLFNKYKPCNLNGVPYIFEILNKIGFEKLKKNLRYITQAGGKLEKKLRDKIIEFCKDENIKFYIMYGQAEASPRISIMPWNLLQKFPDSVGLPLPGGKIKIKKKSKADTDGEIVYKGKNVFLGYSNSYRDLKNKDKIKGILNTGDIGFLDKNNLIHLTGRKKRILKIFGIRISLDLLEQELQKHNYQCICNGNDKKLQIHILANTKVNLPELNKLIIEITGINKNFIETIKVKKFQRNAFGKIKYND